MKVKGFTLQECSEEICKALVFTSSKKEVEEKLPILLNTWKYLYAKNCMNEAIKAAFQMGRLKMCEYSDEINSRIENHQRKIGVNKAKLRGLFNREPTDENALYQLKSELLEEILGEGWHGINQGDNLNYL